MISLSSTIILHFSSKQPLAECMLFHKNIVHSLWTVNYCSFATEKQSVQLYGREATDYRGPVDREGHWIS